MAIYIFSTVLVPKPWAHNSVSEASGGSCTPDPLFTKQVLWLLSYRGRYAEEALDGIFKDSYAELPTLSKLRYALICSFRCKVSSLTPLMKPLRKGT